MKYSLENESDAINKLNKNLSQISPTTTTTTTKIIKNMDENLQDTQLTTKLNHMRVPLDYPLCSSLLNEHLFHADFYSGLGPFTINTEWLV